MGQLNFGNIRHSDGYAAAHGHHRLFDIFNSFKSGHGTNHVPAFAFSEISSRDVPVLRAQSLGELRNGDPGRGEQLRFKNNVQLFFESTKDVDARYARDPFKTRFDQVFGQVLQMRCVDAIGQNNKPADSAFKPTGSGDNGAVGIIRVFRDFIQFIRDLHQRCGHVGTDDKFQCNHTLAVAGGGIHFQQPLDRFQILLLLVDNFLFNFLGRSAKPVGCHANDRPLDFRGQLNRYVS